jgi:type III secretory pathway component EscR
VVERWSSKPYVWVRFLLLLSMFNLNPLFKLKNKFLSDEKQKYFNRFSFTKTRSQQNFWYFKQFKKQNNNKTITRSFLK